MREGISYTRYANLLGGHHDDLNRFSAQMQKLSDDLTLCDRDIPLGPVPTAQNLKASIQKRPTSLLGSRSGMGKR